MICLQFYTHLPWLVEVRLDGDREGNIFVTCARKNKSPGVQKWRTAKARGFCTMIILSVLIGRRILKTKKYHHRTKGHAKYTRGDGMCFSCSRWPRWYRTWCGTLGVLSKDHVGLCSVGKNGQFYCCRRWERSVLSWVLFLQRGWWIRKVFCSLNYMQLKIQQKKPFSGHEVANLCFRMNCL